jgi:TRAP-type C4-dicarboxylate transport system permease small subunit
MSRGTEQPAERASAHAPPMDGHGSHDERLAINPTIEMLTRWLALAGGVVMLFATAVTIVSVVGRYGFGAPVPGDYEMVELVCAVGVFLFFPYAHATSSNIVVEFFTVKLPPRHKRMLDLLHDVLFAGVAALLAWRLGIGLIQKFQSGESTMLIRIPFWWSYSFAVASLIVLCVVCIARIVAGYQTLRQ